MNKEGEILRAIEEIDEKVLSYVSKSKTSLGSGGMSSKLTFTHLANKMGIKVVIFGMKEENGILKAYHGDSGTAFSPKIKSYNAKTKWLASAGISVGRITVDTGAEKALLDRRSLLAVGVKKHEGDFKIGELIEVLNESGEVIGVGKSRVPSQIFSEASRSKNILIIHADDLVML